MNSRFTCYNVGKLGIKMSKNNKRTEYSPDLLCQQLHALYDLLQDRKDQIVADPDFNPGNDALNQELEDIYFKMKLLQECFEKFCPS